MRVVYTLREDTSVADMQKASLSSGPIGLRITHGLIGSEEWWKNIELGVLPLVTLRGVVSGFWPGHHGDFPEFELREATGARSTWGCMASAQVAALRFEVGTPVEVDYVRQELKTSTGTNNESKLVVQMRLA